MANRCLTFSLTSKPPASKPMPDRPLTHNIILEELAVHSPEWCSRFIASFEDAADSMALTPLEAMAMAVASWTASVHSTVPRT